MWIVLILIIVAHLRVARKTVLLRNLRLNGEILGTFFMYTDSPSHDKEYFRVKEFEPWY